MRPVHKYPYFTFPPFSFPFFPFFVLLCCTGLESHFLVFSLLGLPLAQPFVYVLPFFPFFFWPDFYPPSLFPPLLEALKSGSPSCQYLRFLPLFFMSVMYRSCCLTPSSESPHLIPFPFFSLSLSLFVSSTTNSTLVFRFMTVIPKLGRDAYIFKIYGWAPFSLALFILVTYFSFWFRFVGSTSQPTLFWGWAYLCFLIDPCIAPSPR